MKSTRMTRLTLEKHLGAEPEENSIVETISESLNYYNAFYNRREAIGFFEDYMKVADPKFLETRNYEKIEATVGFIARMKSRNISLPLETVEWFKKQLDSIPAKVEVVKANKVSIKDSPESIAIAEIEERFDKNTLGNFEFLNDMNLSKSISNKVVSFFTPRLLELMEISKDEQLQEAYKCFTDQQIQANIDQLNGLLEALGSEISKEPRKKKVKSPEEITKWMVLNPKEESLGLKTLPASRIIGATTLVFYIPAHRTIQIFHSKVGEVFDVKGKSVMNHDPENSFSKGIRKPETVIADFIGKNDKKIMSAFNKLSTKARDQKTSLISPKHILLSAF